MAYNDALLAHIVNFYLSKQHDIFYLKPVNTVMGTWLYVAILTPSVRCSVTGIMMIHLPCSLSDCYTTNTVRHWRDKQTTDSPVLPCLPHSQSPSRIPFLYVYEIILFFPIDNRHTKQVSPGVMVVVACCLQFLLTVKSLKAFIAFSKFSLSLCLSCNQESSSTTQNQGHGMVGKNVVHCNTKLTALAMNSLSVCPSINCLSS